jgi:pyruvate formate lyase activating enzyme
LAIKRKRFVAVRGKNCIKCTFCRQYIDCAAEKDACNACGACVIACPQNAIKMKPLPGQGSEISFTLDDVVRRIDGPITVMDALRAYGQTSEPHKACDGCIQALCGTGGCWSCAVLIDGVLARSCNTTLRQGMEIVTQPRRLHAAQPKRMVTVMRPAPHFHPSIFTHGCNYRCDLCHNWDLTFSATGDAKTPREAVDELEVNPETDYWIGISGGEPTLNRGWLIETVQRLRQQAGKARIQLDTNASLLTPDYIDQLVEAGVTDISPDIKARHLDAFMKISGLQSKAEAGVYLKNSWETVRYLQAAHPDTIFMAVSFPCHPRIHSRTELYDMGQALATINPKIPVTLIEYQPAFRARNWPRLTHDAMNQVRDIVQSAGLERVIIQGGRDMPRAVDPLELALTTETF